MRSKLMVCVFVLAAAMIGASYTEGFAQSRVAVKGSTTVLPITQKAIEVFTATNKNVSISVDGSGSGNGIKALLDGNTDIANSSRAMKTKEKETAREKGIKIKEIVLAYDMIVPIVHPSNPIANLTKEQLKAIYNGNITNWKEIGGKNQNIIVVSRDSSSGTYEYWNEDVLEKSDVTSSALYQASNGAVVTVVASNPKAIGYIGFGYTNKSVKVLNVNGIHATIQNGKSGRYPISRQLYMYVNENNYSGAAKSFVSFLLSGRGQNLVKDAGYIPLR